MNKKKIFISGYLGYYNPGDDLMLKILLERLNYKNVILLVKKNYYNQKSIYRYNLIKFFFSIRRDDILINLGGIFQDITSFKSFLFYFFINLLTIIRGGKIILLNIDAVDIKHKISFYLLQKLLKLSSFVCFRDKVSYNKYKYMKNVYYIPDLVFLTNLNNVISNKNYKIINPINKKQIKYISSDAVLIINKGEEKYYKKRTKNILVYNYKNLDILLSKICNAGKIITGRYHIALLGFLCGKEIEFVWKYKKLEVFYNEFIYKKNKKNIDNKNKRVYNIEEIEEKWKKFFIKIQKELY